MADYNHDFKAIKYLAPTSVGEEITDTARLLARASELWKQNAIGAKSMATAIMQARYLLDRAEEVNNIHMGD